MAQVNYPKKNKDENKKIDFERNKHGVFVIAAEALKINTSSFATIRFNATGATFKYYNIFLDENKEDEENKIIKLKI